MLQLPLQSNRVHDVIRIHAHEDRRLTQAQTLIERIHNARTLTLNQANVRPDETLPFSGFRHRANQFRALISRSIVDQEYLEVRVALIQNRLQAIIQGICCIAKWYDYAGCGFQ